MNKHYILKDGDKYYVAESQATWNKDKALKLDSITDLITKVPLMKDWNIDYIPHEVVDGKERKMKDSEWYDEYKDWEKENPEAYKKLYSGNYLDNMVRVTSS